MDATLPSNDLVLPCVCDHGPIDLFIFLRGRRFPAVVASVLTPRDRFKVTAVSSDTAVPAAHAAALWF